MNRLLAVCFSLFATAILAGPLTAQNECANRREISETIPLGSAGRVNVHANAGSLRISGRAGLSQVRVTGTACASSASRLAALAVETGVSGGEVDVTTVIPESRSWFRRSPSGHIDLVVEIPEDALLNVTDESGSIEISGVRGGLMIEDASGSLEIANVGGGVQVNDGAGSLTIRDIEADVRLVDGSGSITVENVRGSVVVEEDGSGSMDIRRVTGSVLVRQDGSGSITVEHTGGDFVVDRGGSGSIRFSEIAGAVEVPRRR